jgi:pimeloyl-ACP methyl ester carboxylesterase
LVEFFSPPLSPEKVSSYAEFRRLFDAAVPHTAVVRHEVPYGGAHLPAYWHPAVGTSGGIVLIHGGFDSLIEEFFAVSQRVAAAGFDVIAFDGPGQGGARAIGEVLSDHDWEKPVSAVLDHFGVASAALVGISMGGYWSVRAAGREPRIKRVVSWPPVYDWLNRVPRPVRGLTRAMLRRQRLMTWSVRIRTRLVPTLRHVVDQALYISGGHESIDAVRWFVGMNSQHLGSEHVEQDVLVLCGENDPFQPPALARAQERALARARSVTVRTFTKNECADQHCQMGNLRLACDVLTSWLRRTQREPVAGDDVELR